MVSPCASGRAIDLGWRNRAFIDALRETFALEAISGRAARHAAAPARDRPA